MPDISHQTNSIFQMKKWKARGAFDLDQVVVSRVLHKLRCVCVCVCLTHFYSTLSWDDKAGMGALGLAGQSSWDPSCIRNPGWSSEAAPSTTTPGDSLSHCPLLRDLFSDLQAGQGTSTSSGPWTLSPGMGSWPEKVGIVWE